MSDLPGFRWLPGMLDTKGNRIVSVRYDGRILTDMLGLNGLPAQLSPDARPDFTDRQSVSSSACGIADDSGLIVDYDAPGNVQGVPLEGRSDSQAWRPEHAGLSAAQGVTVIIAIVPAPGHEALVAEGPAVAWSLAHLLVRRGIAAEVIVLPADKAKE